MELSTEKVDHETEAVRERLFEFLAPHEVRCLFVTGNLKNNFPGSHIYVAARADEWVGAAGYYETPRSVVPFADDPATARALVRRVAEEHPEIECVNGMADTVRPACEELGGLGYDVKGDPRQVFMRLDMQSDMQSDMQPDDAPPPQPHEDLARLMAPGDHEAVARLMRCLRGTPPGPPVTDEELRKVRMNPCRHVVVAGGEVVSVASTNGMGVAAFQIIGVATAEPHRGNGYAGAACASLIRAMRAEGARAAVIFTRVANQPALRCYEKLGFRETGEYWVANMTCKPKAR
jgi:RimJ/RimL family protein N-acetyltransferase